MICIRESKWKVKALAENNTTGERPFDPIKRETRPSKLEFKRCRHDAHTRPLLPNRSPGFAACVPAGADRAGVCSRHGRVAACLLLRGSREDGHPVPPPWSRAARAPGTGRRTRCPRLRGGASRHPDSPLGVVPSRSKVRSRDFCPREPQSLVLAFRKVLE